MTQFSIKVDNLCHRYGSRNIYENLSFKVEKGTIFGLLGKNGVGKSTLINILMGFLRPVSGECLVLGEQSHKLSPLIRSRIALLHEGHLAYEYMTITQIEKFFAAFYPNWNRKLFFQMTDMMELPHSHKISNMSNGQRSQIVLGLLLAQQPELLILDDYSLGLDAGYRRLFLDFLQEYVKTNNATVFVTSHVVTDMERLIDEILFLDRGGNFLQTGMNDFSRDFKCFRFKLPKNYSIPVLDQDKVIRNSEHRHNSLYLYTFAEITTLLNHLKTLGKSIASMVSFERVEIPMNLEDAFIGLMGKY